MSYKTLISAEILQHSMYERDWVIIDCRFALADSAWGNRTYRRGHLPNARYADLNLDLSAPVKSNTGRHPLPDVRVLAKKLGAWGINNYSQVIVYDSVGGAIAGRLWWLLRWLGHEQVAVLNGGIQAWQHIGGALTTALPKPTPAVFRPYLDSQQVVNARQVEDGLATRAIRLIDARTSERFLGLHEPIDACAGHIPYAINRPMQKNLNANGFFMSPHQLQAEFTHVLGTYPARQVVHQCGSGITACHNILAMEVAGLSGSKLYAGSWSEWITNKNRKVVGV